MLPPSVLSALAALLTLTLAAGPGAGTPDNAKKQAKRPKKAAEKSCPVTFDMRFRRGTQLTQLDKENPYIDPKNVLGKGLKWSDVLSVPKGVPPSLFDTKFTPVRLEISDKSIFVPDPKNPKGQPGFRRSEMVSVKNTNDKDDVTSGSKTLHFSLRQDKDNPVKTTSEVQLVWLESKDYSTNQFAVKYGPVNGQSGKVDPDDLQVFGNVNAKPPQVLFSTKFKPDVWHNFAINLDFTKGETRVFYSQDRNALNATGPAQKNDVSGNGQMHFGILKKGNPIGKNPPVDGVQPTGIKEAVNFGSIFLEDSSSGCMTLKP